MTDRVEKTVSFELPKGFTFSEFNLDVGYFKCPNCGEFKASQDPGKMIGSCISCGQNLQFQKRSAMFIKEANTP